MAAPPAHQLRQAGGGGARIRERRDGASTRKAGEHAKTRATSPGSSGHCATSPGSSGHCATSVGASGHCATSVGPSGREASSSSDRTPSAPLILIVNIVNHNNNNTVTPTYDTKNPTLTFVILFQTLTLYLSSPPRLPRRGGKRRGKSPMRFAD